MEPITIAMGFATALCIVFLIYGAWLCIAQSEHPTEPEAFSDDPAEADGGGESATAGERR